MYLVHQNIKPQNYYSRRKSSILLECQLFDTIPFDWRSQLSMKLFYSLLAHSRQGIFPQLHFSFYHPI